MGTLNITEAAKVELKDASKYVLWDSNGTVFTSNFQVSSTSCSASGLLDLGYTNHTSLYCVSQHVSVWNLE